MISGGSPEKEDPKEALAAKGFALGKRIGAGEFGEVYVASYGGEDPNIRALLNKDGELVVKIPKTPVYKANPNLTEEERIKAERTFAIRVGAATKTVENEFNIITGGLGELSLSEKGNFIPKVYAESVGGTKLIFNEFVNGMNLETYLRQLGKNELTEFLSLAAQSGNDNSKVTDPSSGYDVVDNDDENVGYLVEPDEDAVAANNDDDVNVGYLVEDVEASDSEENTLEGEDEPNADESNHPTDDLNGVPVNDHETTKKLIVILNALGPLIEKFNKLGFAHNDLSCRNVMVLTEPDGSLIGLKLVDFGLTLKLGKDGNCIDNPEIGVCPRTLYGRLDKRWDRGVVTEGMCLQYAKIEALAIFMGYLALPEAGAEKNQDVKNVFTDIHQKWLTCKNGTIANQHDNAERLATSVSNLDAAAANLEIDNGDEPARDPRGVIVEHIVGVMKSELLQVPVLDQAKFNAFASPATVAAEVTSVVLTEVHANKSLSVNAVMHQAIGANKNTAIHAKTVEGVDENKKVSDNVNSNPTQMVDVKKKAEGAQDLGPGRRK